MRWITAIVVAASCGVTAYAVHMRLVAADSAQAAPTAAGRPTDEPLRVFAAGIVEGLQAPLELRFEIPGRVTAVRVREGDAVQPGQVLAEIDSATYDARVLQAEAQVRIAQAERTRLAAPRARRGGTAEAPRVTLAAASVEELAIADARVAAAEAALQLEELLRSKTALTAPIGGTILAVALQPGQAAGQSDAAPAITLVNRGRTRVRAYVEELDAQLVQPGQTATVVASGRGDVSYSGTLIFCAPYVQPKSHRHLNPGERLDVRVREILIDLDEGRDLLIGLPVEVFVDAAPRPRGAARNSPTKAGARRSEPAPALTTNRP